MVGIVKKPIVSVFSKPSENSEMTDEVLHGWSVKILAETGNFYYIETDYGYNGYVKRDTLSFSSQIINYYNSEKNIVVSNFTDILQEPNFKSKILENIPKGSYIYGFEEDGDYAKVMLASNIFGYICSKSIKKIQKSLSYDKIDATNQKKLRIDIIDIAGGYFKTGYRWGGKTCLGIDCSGLSFMSYFLLGINIYRDAKIMPNFPIKKIPISNIKPADLIFFSGHVAIFIGDGAFIHSSLYNNGVDINFFGDTYFNTMQPKLLYGGSIF